VICATGRFGFRWRDRRRTLVGGSQPFLLVVTMGSSPAGRGARLRGLTGSETANDACRGERASVRRGRISVIADRSRMGEEHAGSVPEFADGGLLTQRRREVTTSRRACIMDAIVVATHSATATHTYRVRMTSVQRPFSVRSTS
jgi:hypothetical protein